MTIPPHWPSRSGRAVALLAAVLLSACAADPPPPPARAAARPRAPVLPAMVEERQNPHRLMLLADNELDVCQDGIGTAKQQACQRRTVYVERARRLGWCLVSGGPTFPGMGWSPCPARR